MFFLHKEAKEELADIIEGYEKEEQGKGFRFESEVYLSIDEILNFPKAWSKTYRGYRKYPLDNFPYRIIYKHDENSNIWKIAAIAHERREENYWRDRKF